MLDAPTLQLDKPEIHAPVRAQFAEILTPGALAFVATLIREFRRRRSEILDRRHETQAALAVYQL